MTNKTALITGGSRGIGAATAELLRERGWDVIAPTRAELEFGRNDAEYNFVTESLDAIVFSHGVWYSRLLGEQHALDWWRQYNARVFGPFNLIGAELDKIERSDRRGCVVFVSSTQAFDGSANTAPYACACAAQLRLMRGMSKTVETVRFNAIACGLTDTDMGQDVIRTGGAKPGAAMQPPGAVAAEIVRLIESNDNGRVMRVVNSEVSEAKWSW